MNESTKGRGKAKQWDSIERERERGCVMIALLCL